ncbi:MAG: hypothetical protein N2746_06830 [Deltaproteobacteria bacterium]|nr:hypothetical protein [Deltaproteobacteria bacterium]
MDRVLNEVFKRLLDVGIQSHYSATSQKIHISVTKNDEIEKVRSIIKKFKLRLSFIDTANSNIILENKINESKILLNKESSLLTVGVLYNIIEAEKFLNAHGFSIGYYFPPVLSSTEMTFADWIKNFHIPSLNYYDKDLSGNIRGIKGILPNGNTFETINAPRMATGSDIVRLLLLAGQNLFSPFEITLRIRPLKHNIKILSFSSKRIKNLLSALASLALKNIKIEFATLYTREDQHNDPMLEIGYNQDDIFDFMNWIVRTVNNEGVSLINTLSEYDEIKMRLNNLIKHEYQIEIYAKYKGIGKLDEILKSLFQNIRFNGYLYRYEKNSFSFRVILPPNLYQQLKDNLISECSKYKEDIRISECTEGSKDQIPLSIYSKIIHSCL